MRHRKLLILPLLTLAAPLAAQADLGCLSGMTGRGLTWDARWQADGQDNGTPYAITNLLDIRSAESHEIRLELQAQSSAQLKQRVLVVQDPGIAVQICKNLSSSPLARAGTNRNVTLSPEPPSVNEPISAAPKFIRYSASGWIRDDPPARKNLTTCKVLTQTFSCLPEEKERYGPALKDLELQLSYLSKNQ